MDHAYGPCMPNDVDISIIRLQSRMNKRSILSVDSSIPSYIYSYNAKAKKILLSANKALERVMMDTVSLYWLSKKHIYNS